MFIDPVGPDFTFKFLVVEVHLEHLFTASCSKQTWRGNFCLFPPNIARTQSGTEEGQGHSREPVGLENPPKNAPS